MLQLNLRQRELKFWCCLVLGLFLLVLADWALIWLVYGMCVMHVFGVMEAVIMPVALLFGIIFIDIARKA